MTCHFFFLRTIIEFVGVGTSMKLPFSHIPFLRVYIDYDRAFIFKVMWIGGAGNGERV